MSKASDLITCPHCKKQYSKFGIKNHIAVVHLKDTARVSHNKGMKRAIPAWNKGLSKETNTIVAQMVKTTSKTLTGKKGKEHSEKTKKKISDARLKYGYPCRLCDFLMPR